MKRGFTLLELLISTAIFTFLILAVFQVMEAGRSSWSTGDTEVELRQEIIKSFMVMDAELKRTRPAQTSLTSGTSSASITFKLPADSNGDGTILAANGTVEWGSAVVYALNADGQITRSSGNVTRVVANHIQSLLFTRPATPVNMLQIYITANKTSSKGRQLQDSGQFTVKMRN